MNKLKNALRLMSEAASEIHKKRGFYCLLAVIGFLVSSVVVLYLGSAPSLTQITEGDVALRTIYAPYDFTYPTSIDREMTELAQSEMEAKVSPVYDIDSSVQDAQFADLDNFFDNLNEISSLTEETDPGRVESLKEKIGSQFSNRRLSRLLEMKEIHRMRKASKDALENVFLTGILRSEERDGLIRQKVSDVTLRNTRFALEKKITPNDLVDQVEAGKIIRDSLERMIPRDKTMRNIIYEIVESRITTNASLNQAETNTRKEEARSHVLPVYKRDTVKKNELIVERGKRLTKDDIAKLAQITRIHAIVNRTAYMFGLLLVLLGLVLVGVGYLKLFQKEAIQSPKYVLLISINAFIALALALIIVQSHVSGYIIPLASIGMILVLLLNAHVAFVVTFIMSVYIGFMSGGKLDLTFTLFIGSVAGLYAVRGARRRSQIFLAGFAVALANLFSIVGIGLLNNMQKESIFGEGLYGLASGIISSFVVIGLLPVFEYAFRLITNITLLELSDLSSPVLKELTIKAPGTYHHSILVGNLAEEACNSIGANSLLARVGSYYHDIGKMEKSAYFVENEIGTDSKHDKLTPSMSALVITNHAKDGVDLAKKHNLNRAIMDFISQHHGTSLIYYFYQRALEKVSSEDDLKEEEFRYPGPKPQTKETAIVLLADSVEASSRMLSDPTPARIRSLVEKIMNNKFIDGQLDECELTLKDLHKISESFVRVLMGIFHTRLEYPEVKSKKERKNDLKNRNK